MRADREGMCTGILIISVHFGCTGNSGYHMSSESGPLGGSWAGCRAYLTCMPAESPAVLSSADVGSVVEQRRMRSLSVEVLGVWFSESEGEGGRVECDGSYL